MLLTNLDSVIDKYKSGVMSILLVTRPLMPSVDLVRNRILIIRASGIPRELRSNVKKICKKKYYKNEL